MSNQWRSRSVSLGLVTLLLLSLLSLVFAIVTIILLKDKAKLTRAK